MQQGLSDDLYHRVDEYAAIEAFSEAEKLAAECAERFVLDHQAMMADEEFWGRMKASFDDRQILELLVTIGYCLGIGRVLAVLDIANDCSVNLTAEPEGDPARFAHG